MPTYLRRWYYSTYFSGDKYVDVPLVATEQEVKAMIDQLHYRDNWKTDSLRRGGKVKERKS